MICLVHQVDEVSWSSWYAVSSCWAAPGLVGLILPPCGYPSLDNTVLGSRDPGDPLNSYWYAKKTHHFHVF
jgi:hypothetical protein